VEISERMKIGVVTYGCAVNKADSELMATLLKDEGFELVLESEKADIILVNTCIVKGPTEDKILRKLKDLQKAGKKVIIAGCMSKAYPKITDKFPGFAVIGTNSMDITEVVRNYLIEGKSKEVREAGEKVLPKKVRYNEYIDIVQISEGCLGFCSFCSTKLARGKLISYSPDAIVKEIEQSVKNGAKEIWLTSQDNGCYGFDIGTNLTELLKRIVQIPGDFKVRNGMMNPGYLNKFLDDLVEVYKDEKVFKFAHIPVQSGSDKVLKEMKRGYTTKDFEGIVSKFRKAMDLTISTDIIVGFPTETEEDFQETMDFLKRIEVDFLNLSKYWPRKKTEAGEMKQLPRDVVAARSRKAGELSTKIIKTHNKDWIGKKCSVTFTEKKSENSVGRNSLYRPVLVKGNLIGKTCSVTITDTKKSELIGKCK
jgi:threonylcarbamoyladenosine tRNA methylthiotransferase CDKAL1